MKLLSAKAEPTSATCRKSIGFRQFNQTQQAGPKGAGLIFATFGYGKLDMVNLQCHRA
jgi:hypothetical protein